ncbi:recombinase RecT [Companilactobacillus ginsenosidimutans]|uniref:Recombinase RecT n=1 Tax=Companilactobacillus ginsenosidimutans TaxID=1007676 RepID=A0A0H4QMH7_9LACO|nr:recombinase RecT [Companilactobacillus ginsenosidimutans]AKP66118.1 recombinase RecT [Companilactobacillus ginsenosidimutans]AKP68326.1 recombinase RecT [Companilactobacillus ginsenosidimutans]
MVNNLAKLPIQTLVKEPKIVEKFESVLGNKSAQFVTSLINVVNSNQSLKNVDQMSVVASAMVAASLDLPINQDLGYMWLVPYGGKAQPQMGYKGYIQLAQRTGQYKHLNAVAVYEDEFQSYNPLTEQLDYEPHFKDRDSSEKPVGYVGYFELTSGFEKTVYWTRKQIDDHRQNFSKMSGKSKPSGVWATNFDAMALKTVLRNLISKWGPMSVEMQKAYESDEQATTISTNDIKDIEAQEQEPATDVSQLINGNATEANVNDSTTNSKDSE